MAKNWVKNFVDRGVGIAYITVFSGVGRGRRFVLALKIEVFCYGT